MLFGVVIGRNPCISFVNGVCANVAECMHVCTRIHTATACVVAVFGG